MRGSQKRRAASAVVALAAASVLVGGTSTASADTGPEGASWTTYVFRSESIPIRRQGTPYLVRVIAWERNGHAELNIWLTERNDPDGAVENRRNVDFMHATRFEADDSLSSAVLDPSASQMAGRGQVDMVWVPSAPATTSCDGTETHRPGRLDGVFRFATQVSAVGELRFEQLPGTLTRIAGLGCEPAPGRCAQTGFHLQSYGGGSITGFHRGGRSWLEAVRSSDGGGGWSIYQQVLSYVPDDHVTLAANERSGAMRGAPGAWFHGTSSFSSPTPSEEGDPMPCRGGREWTSETNSGELTRGIHADLLVGPDFFVEGEATVGRTTLRPATSG